MAAEPRSGSSRGIGSNPPGGATKDCPAARASSDYLIFVADCLDSAVKLTEGCPALEGGPGALIFETSHVV